MRRLRSEYADDEDSAKFAPHTTNLWVQDRLRRGDFRVTKVLGADHPADLLTKHVPRDVMRKHMIKIGLVSEDGRAASAPTIQHK